MSSKLLIKSFLPLLLTLIVAVTSAVYYAYSLRDLLSSQTERQNFISLAQELQQTSDDLTRMVRTYVATGDDIYKRHFKEILYIRDGKAPRPTGLGQVYWDLVGPDDRRPSPSGPPVSLLELMHKSGISESEIEILRQSKNASDLLTNTEFAAISLIESDFSPEARLRAIQMLNDSSYHQAKATIMSGIARFEEQVSQRTLSKLNRAETSNRYSLILLLVASALAVFLFWRILYSLSIERDLYQLEQSMLESEKRFRLMTNEIIDYAIIFLDVDGRVASWNSGAERIKGYTQEEILGQSMAVFYPPEDMASGKPDNLLEQAKTAGRVMDEGWRIRKDGSRFYANMVLTAVHDRFGKLIGFVKISHDITERKAVEKAMAAAKELAEAASRAKSEFLANMSHEIRTPMNGVIGMAEVLLKTPLSHEQNKMLQIIQNSAQTQLGILNDILDFSKIEAGRLEFSIGPFSLADVVGNTCANLTAYAQQQGVTLRHEMDARIPAVLAGDDLRVRQVLSNLVNNAIKFSSGLERAGEVEVAARWAGEADGMAWIELSVRDNGIGMDDETLQRMFHSFTQADASTTRKYGGTGLGLVICQRLVAAMGGEIRVESAPDVGSTFTVRLPFMRTDEVLLVPASDAKELPCPLSIVPNREAAIRQGRLILVAEDNETNQAVIQQQLSLLGYRCDITRDGREAFGKWLDGEYGLILSDIHMPNMDGYQLAEAIRAEETKRGAGHIPILALTANVLKGEVDLCKASGMDGYLAKPVPLSQLMGQLVHWLPAAASASDQGGEAPVDEEPAAEPPVFDPDVLTRIVGNSPATRRRLLAKFLATAAELAASLCTAYAEDDVDSVTRIAHSLKSSARAVGAMQLGELCEKIERSGKASDLAMLRIQMASFDAVYDMSIKAIDVLLSRK